MKIGFQATIQVLFEVVPEFNYLATLLITELYTDLTLMKRVRFQQRFSTQHPAVLK